jgi:hypothetical protein
LKYRNSPKEENLVAAKKDLSDGYQRLGLWNDWKDQQIAAYEMEEGELDDLKKANSQFKLARI